ncbi:lipid-A-disaccharide synthase N-terminal domain-containing protein [Kushneria sp. Sum13]|uniref:lipid-A-disaccharide synthase N-terminal domain-containing protein n=1 Tax=Kushneria sp. Sum13 TaxID=3459196 RepID=UPI004045E0F1
MDSAALWIVVGLLGQALFSARFIVQWLASERAKRSIVPHLFWYLSIGGGLILLLYALYRRDPVFIIGQGSGLFIYVRNLVLIRREKRQAVEAGASDTAVERAENS